MSHDNDPIAVTANLRDLVRVFVDGVYYTQSKKQAKAIDDCFRLFLGRGPTPEEIEAITLW